MAVRLGGARWWRLGVLAFLLLGALRRWNDDPLCSAVSRMPAVVWQAESLRLDAGTGGRAADLEFAGAARGLGGRSGRCVRADRRDAPCRPSPRLSRLRGADQRRAGQRDAGGSRRV